MSGDPQNERDDQAPETSAWAGLSAAWRDRPTPPVDAIDVAAIRARAARFAWTVRLRNLAEWSACALLIVVGVRSLVSAEQRSMWPVSCALIAVSLWVAIYLWRNARNVRAPAPSATTVEHLAYERQALRRQHRLLSNVRRWYLAPIFAVIAFAYVWVAVGRARSAEGLHGAALVHVGMSFAGQVAFFALLDFINRRAARKVAKKMAALDERVEQGTDAKA